MCGGNASKQSIRKLVCLVACSEGSETESLCIWHDWKKPVRKRKNLIRLGVDHYQRMHGVEPEKVDGLSSKPDPWQAINYHV